jgi:proteasome lid subunit RPN8/RPN11
LGELEPDLILQRADWLTMREHVCSLAPEEACGLVAGKGKTTMMVFRETNSYHSHTQFRMEAEGQVRAFLKMEELGFDLLAIYHSHPAGPDHPSPTDLAEHAYPETAVIIWFPQGGEWVCKGFWIQKAGYRGLSYRIED